MTRSRVLLVLCGCVLLGLAVRPWSLGPLAWVALVPLFIALQAERRPAAGAGFAAMTMTLPALVAYEGIAPLSPGLAAAAVVLACLPYALFGALAVLIRRSIGRAAFLVASPFLWCAAESLPAQPWLVGPFASPLVMIGYSQFGLPAMQLASLGGVSAVSFWLVSMNAAAAALYRMPRALTFAILALLALPPVTTAVVGSKRKPRSAETPTIRVRLVQPALPDAAYAAAQDVPGARARLVADLVELATTAPDSGATGAVDLTVFPEGALPGPISTADEATGASKAPLRSMLQPLLEPLGPTLFGASARSAAGVHNAVFSWDGRRLRHVYDKRYLVPFTERHLVPGVATEVTHVAGTELAPLVCFEAAFSELALGAARAGAQLLVVLTNDAFASFLDTPLLHLRVAAFRAVETGVPLVFASNAGPSAVIDASGRVTAMTRPRERAVLDATLSPGASRTPFVRWGDRLGKTTRLLAMGLVGLVGARGGRSLA